MLCVYFSILMAKCICEPIHKILENADLLYEINFQYETVPLTISFIFFTSLENIIYFELLTFPIPNV